MSHQCNFEKFLFAQKVGKLLEKYIKVSSAFFEKNFLEIRFFFQMS